METPLSLIGRTKPLFASDFEINEPELKREIAATSFLVLGGGGSIGQGVVKLLFKYSPLKLHVVDISENNLVELVRDVRSQHGYISGDFKTYALDIDSAEYDAFVRSDGQYDYILNLSALKHVRSEKDPFTLMRMLNVNILNTKKTIDHAITCGAKKYFCVSTDKAAAPVNLMGASKRIMELMLFNQSQKMKISTARFANVAFSDGSLLHGFLQRITKGQPIAAPTDIKRYFVTTEEAAKLCILSCVLGKNREILFPKIHEKLPLTSVTDIAIKTLERFGYSPVFCASEQDARQPIEKFKSNHQWPCYFEPSNTTGEKPEEEFFTPDETPNFSRFKEIGVLENNIITETAILDKFENELLRLKKRGHWKKEDLINALKIVLPNLPHQERGKNLDEKM